MRNLVRDGLSVRDRTVDSFLDTQAAGRRTTDLYYLGWIVHFNRPLTRRSDGCGSSSTARYRPWLQGFRPHVPWEVPVRIGAISDRSSPARCSQPRSRHANMRLSAEANEPPLDR